MKIKYRLSLIIYFLVLSAITASPKTELYCQLEDNIFDMKAAPDGTLYILTTTGGLLRIGTDKKIAVIAVGLKTNRFSIDALCVLPDGTIACSDNLNGRDVVVRIDKKGKKKIVAQPDGNIVSMASDNRGTVYIGTWSASGNIHLADNPKRLAETDLLCGVIWSLDGKNNLRKVMEGGVPLSLAVDADDRLFCSLWGKKGAFQFKEDTYRIVDPRHVFWIALSKMAAVVRVEADGRFTVIEYRLRAVSSIACASDGFIFAFGLNAEEERAIFILQEEADPVKLEIENGELPDNIVCLNVVGGTNLFFSTFSKEKGKIYRLQNEKARLDKIKAQPLAKKEKEGRRHENLGWYWYTTGAYAAALVEFTNALNFINDSSSAFEGRGMAYMMLKNYDEAIADFNRALAIKENQYDLNFRGMCYSAKNMLDEAERDFLRAIELDPSKSYPYANLGLNYLQLKKDKKKAEWYLKKACDLGDCRALETAKERSDL